MEINLVINFFLLIPFVFNSLFCTPNVSKNFQMLEKFPRNLNFWIISISLKFSKNETTMVSKPYSAGSLIGYADTKWRMLCVYCFPLATKRFVKSRQEKLLFFPLISSSFFKVTNKNCNFVTCVELKNGTLKFGYFV